MCFLISFLVVFFVAAIGSIISARALKSRDIRLSSSGQDTLQRDIKISGAPRPMVFGIVWTLLYIGLFVAGGFVLYNATQEGAFGAAGGLALVFMVNLLLNLLWVITVFGLFKYGIGLAILAIMLVTCALVIWLSINTHNWACLVVFIFYTLWLCVATYLNYRLTRVKRASISQQRKTEQILREDSSSMVRSVGLTEADLDKIRVDEAAVVAAKSSKRHKTDY